MYAAIKDSAYVSEVISTLGAPPIYRKRFPEAKQPAPERDARKMI